MQTHEQTGFLTAEQIEQYEANGFLVLPGYFDERTVEELARAADEVVSRVGPLVPGNPRVQVDSMGDRVGIRQAWPVIDLSPTLARMAKEERVLRLFRSLFGGEQPVLFEDKLNYKHPGVGSLFAMHQDYSYWDGYSPQLVSLLIYLDEATSENGCLEVARGWHKRGLLERSEMDVGPIVDHYITPDVLPPSSVVKVTGGPGTAVIFSCFTPHASGPNRSDRSRRVFILTYNPASDGDRYEESTGANRDRSRAWLSSH